MDTTRFIPPTYSHRIGAQIRSGVIIFDLEDSVISLLYNRSNLLLNLKKLGFNNILIHTMHWPQIDTQLDFNLYFYEVSSTVSSNSTVLWKIKL